MTKRRDKRVERREERREERHEEPRTGRLDSEDRPERQRVYDDEVSGPRKGRDIEFQETGDRDLQRPERR